MCGGTVSHRVVVVGGGIAGASVAFALARRGAAVTVVDDGRVGAATAASGDRRAVDLRCGGGVLRPVRGRGGVLPDGARGTGRGRDHQDLSPPHRRPRGRHGPGHAGRCRAADPCAGTRGRRDRGRGAPPGQPRRTGAVPTAGTGSARRVRVGRRQGRRAHVVRRAAGRRGQPRRRGGHPATPARTSSPGSARPGSPSRR